VASLGLADVRSLMPRAWADGVEARKVKVLALVVVVVVGLAECGGEGC